jgi:hypothetical protein
MEWIFLIIVGASVALSTILCFAYRRTAEFNSAYKPTVDPEQLRKDMLAEANSPEELAYLQEMSELDLHRRHIVC